MSAGLDAIRARWMVARSENASLPQIADSQADVPPLLARIDRALALHQPFEDMGSSHPRCDVCPAEWPCPTVRALTGDS